MKRFGYPEFDENGVRTLSTYDNEYSHMLMDIRVYRMKAGDKKNFSREGEEVAVLLLKGKVKICAGELSMTCSRESVFVSSSIDLKCVSISINNQIFKCSYNFSRKISPFSNSNWNFFLLNTGLFLWIIRW